MIKATIIAFLALNLLATVSASSLGDTLGSFKDKTEKAVKDLSDSVCIVNENCNRFFTLNNYCCLPKCCNIFEYITRNDNYWNNFAQTFEEPRAMNIILAILFTLIVVLLIGLIVKLICCLFCGCCGTKKYVIVGRGD